MTQLADGDWKRPTPCAGWNARDLVGHLATSMRVAISSMRGWQPAWPDVTRPGDLVEGDPAEFWRGIVGQTRDVLRITDLTQPKDNPLGRASQSIVGDTGIEPVTSPV